MLLYPVVQSHMYVSLLYKLISICLSCYVGDITPVSFEEFSVISCFPTHKTMYQVLRFVIVAFTFPGF